MDDTIKYSVVIVVIVRVAIAGYLVFNSAENSNTITIAGSTSVAPVAEALANAYMSKYPGVKITVTGGDSSMGIDSVRSGQVAIGTSSRNLTSSEADGLSQYTIGEDAIAIIVNDQNTVNSISLNQLMSIYTGNITNWNQLGGNNSPITPVTREMGSGTRADFEEMILGNNTYAHNVVVAASTYEVLQTVAVSPNDLGYVARNALSSQVKVLNVNNISLNQQNVENGSYPLKRSMLFLVKGTPTRTVKDFIDFSLSPEGQTIVNNVEYGSTSNNTITQNPGIGPAGG